MEEEEEEDSRGKRILGPCTKIYNCRKDESITTSSTAITGSLQVKQPEDEWAVEEEEKEEEEEEVHMCQ
jgi:hypothetical protein